MKRDLKKWLKSDEALELARIAPSDSESPLYNTCQEIIEEANDKGIKEMEQVIQIIWCSAQKQFLKDILDDIDDLIDKTFNGNDQVVGDKARHVSEEANLKEWLYSKYKHLQKKNGK